MLILRHWGSGQNIFTYGYVCMSFSYFTFHQTQISAVSLQDLEGTLCSEQPGVGVGRVVRQLSSSVQDPLWRVCLGLSRLKADALAPPHGPWRPGYTAFLNRAWLVRDPTLLNRLSKRLG